MSRDDARGVDDHGLKVHLGLRNHRPSAFVGHSGMSAEPSLRARDVTEETLSRPTDDSIGVGPAQRRGHDLSHTGVAPVPPPGLIRWRLLDALVIRASP
jgi:hypothetical protein